MNILNCMTTNDNWYIVLLVGLLVAAAIYLIWRFFGSQEVLEAADPELLAENVAEYRDACLNRIVTYIMYRYNVPADKMEGAAKSYQTELQKICIEVPINDLLYTLFADYDINQYKIVAQQVLPDGTIICLEDKIRIKDGYMCDYVWLQNFINKVDAAVSDWATMNYMELIQNLSAAAANPVLKELPDDRKNDIFFTGLLELTYLLEQKKYRKNEFTTAYLKLLTYLHATGQRDEFIKFIQEINGLTNEEVEETERNEEV